MFNLIHSSDVDLGIVTINSKLLILEANEKFKNLYDVKEKDTLYKKSKLAQTVAISFERKSGVSGILIHETTLETPSYFLIYSFPSNEEGEFSQTILLCDISELYQYWESWIEEERRKLIGDMAAGFADIILNPLTVVKGCLELIRQRIRGISTLTSDAVQSIEGFVSLANQEANNINKHTQRLLQIGKPFEMEVTPVSLSSILQEFLPYVQQEALKKNFIFTIEFPTKDGELLVHRVYLNEVLREIIKNSFEASSEGGRLKIAINVREKDVLFTITDFGVGISNQIKKQVKRPFFTTKDSSIGLGLSFCDIVLNKMGGRMEIQGVQDKTVVKVFLPIVRF